jgi:hypothetical protein
LQAKSRYFKSLTKLLFRAFPCFRYNLGMRVPRLTAGCLLIAAFFSACAPNAVQPSATIPSEIIQTAIQELIIWGTQTAEARPSATPTSTPAPTETPSPSATLPPSPATETAIARMTAPKDDGIYLAGVEIARGLWYAPRAESGVCFWARRKASGVILQSYFGVPGGTLRVQDVDYEIELNGCGIWQYLGP